MKLFRNPAFLAATAMTALLAIYIGLLAERAILLVTSDSLVGKLMGFALIVLPIVGLWYLGNEWRLGTTVQRMATRLEEEGRLPAFEGEALPSGRLPDAAAEEAVQLATREVEMAPEDWASWFHVAWAYDAAGDRRQARKCLRYAAELFRKAAQA
ncbi:hypothetical protein [Demequina sp.]|uniref:hypothetical protein n=1 Tax=Demequina sp. TaxID=2050685 RepID=UPI003D152C49